MKLFGQLVRTAINIIELPIAVGKDLTGQPIITGKSAILEQLEKTKEEAQEE